MATPRSADRSWPWSARRSGSATAGPTPSRPAPSTCGSRSPPGTWGLQAVASIGGDPVPAPPDLAEPALAVLSDPRITLPDTCRWDIHAGRVDPRVLATMLQMADVAPYSVCVFATGHPPNVFGTERESNHAPGRAVDVWAVDGRPVVLEQPSEDSQTFRVAATVHQAGAVTELGSPWDFDEPGGGHSFRNDVHRDHLHVAYHG